MPELRAIFRVRDGDTLAKVIRSQVHTDSELEGIREAKRRLDLFKDRGMVHFESAVHDQYQNDVVRKKIKTFLATADFQNVTRRIVREISTVYSEPAERTLKAKNQNERYQTLLRTVEHDKRMRSLNRFGNLLNGSLVWPVVRDDGVPEERIVTSDKFRPLSHPDDDKRPVAWVLEQFPRDIKATPDKPHYLVLGAEEFIWLSKDWRFLKEERHGLGTLPALLWSKEDPDDAILDRTSGKDIPNAHIAVTLLNARMLMHQKSGTQMAVASGDTSAMARGQPGDDEGIIEAPEGVNLSTLDLKADPQSYIDTVNSVIKQVAANHGIPMSVFDLSYQATSGVEINLKRTGLREMRHEQILLFRPFEQRLVELWARVLDGHALAFEPKGWRIDFGDFDVPVKAKEKLEVWEKLEELGLTNRVEMYRDLNPEASEEEALEAVRQNLEMRVERMRAFQSQNSGTFGPADSDNPPTDRNGNRLRVMEGGGE